MPSLLPIFAYSKYETHTSCFSVIYGFALFIFFKNSFNLNARFFFFRNARLMAFMMSTVPLALFQARFTVYRLCGWIDAARRVYGTPRFVALPAVHSHATPPACCHYP